MNIGLIGCGEIAQAHARHITQSAGEHTIVGVCDIDADKGRRFARQFGIGEVYTDLDPLLEQHRLDVVHVLTPPQTHAALASRAMEAGCNVLVEKPMALSTEQADRMIAAADANNVKLCVNHNLLFDPVILRACTLLRAGTIGDLVCVDMHYGFNVSEASGQEWVGDLPGGILQNLAPHPLYLALEFIDDPIRVHASSSTTDGLESDQPDELRVMMEGQHVIGNLAISLRVKPNHHVLRLCGTKATIHVDLASKLLWVERLRALPRALARGVMNVEISARLMGGTLSNAVSMLLGRLKSYQGLGTLVQTFYRSIETDAPVPVSRESARRVVDVFDRIRAELASPVAL
jgi:predicted dehydrogenase